MSAIRILKLILIILILELPTFVFIDNYYLLCNKKVTLELHNHHLPVVCVTRIKSFISH